MAEGVRGWVLEWANRVFAYLTVAAILGLLGLIEFGPWLQGKFPKLKGVLETIESALSTPIPLYLVIVGALVCALLLWAGGRYWLSGALPIRARNRLNKVRAEMEKIGAASAKAGAPMQMAVPAQPVNASALDELEVRLLYVYAEAGGGDFTASELAGALNAPVLRVEHNAIRLFKRGLLRDRWYGGERHFYLSEEGTAFVVENDFVEPVEPPERTK